MKWFEEEEEKNNKKAGVEMVLKNFLFQLEKINFQFFFLRQ